MRRFSRSRSAGAKILLKEVPDAERFGVAEIDGDRIVGIEEKPKQPKSNYAVTGIYMYDGTVFDKTRTLVPSGRGELEITDVNNAYIQEGTMTFGYLDGWWTDAGTFESLLRAANLVSETRQKQQPVLRRLAHRSARECCRSGVTASGVEIEIPESKPGIGNVILSPSAAT